MELKIAEYKAEGKKCLGINDPLRAAEWYGKAIDLKGDDHILFGNRAECYLRLRKWEKALEDSLKSIELESEWVKGPFRAGQALAGLGRHKEAYGMFIKCMCNKKVDVSSVTDKLQVVEKAWKVAETALPVLGRSLTSSDGFLPGDDVLSEHPLISWSNDTTTYDPKLLSLCSEHGVSPAAGAIGVLSVASTFTEYQAAFVENLCSPEIDFTCPLTISWINLASHIAGSLPSLYSEDAYRTAKLLLSVKCNAHHCVLKDGTKERGGIFRLASKLAHSCSPNLIYQYKDDKVRFTSCRLVTSGAVLSFSYRGELDFLVKSAKERQSELHDAFLFWCGCERCQEADLTRGMRCTSCKGTRFWEGGYSVPTADAPKGDNWVCDTCESRCCDEEMPLKDEKELADLLESLDTAPKANKYTSLKNAVLKAEQVLGTRHWIYGLLCKRLTQYFRSMLQVHEDSIATAQLAVAFGSHYLQFLSKTRVYFHAPLVACHFCATLASSLTADKLSSAPVYQSDKIVTFEEARKDLLKYSTPLMKAVYGQEDSVTQKTLAVWESSMGAVPAAPRHPRDPEGLLPSPPAIIGLFAQWEAEVVKLASGN
eukprot:TRINITY_DN2214_c0_g1_i1.p1 TRINITY_DN2214_c0_g1~~TRINITY_DN2214_c0_g1_i1.p1  ORF type:complete len:596 (+),score=159.79 TRINITY_DN2214_c0_g1_i1:58-1845(+)